MTNCTNIVGTSAYDKFMEGVVAGTLRDFSPIPAGMFSERELYLLYRAGYLYLFQDKGKSCFKAVV